MSENRYVVQEGLTIAQVLEQCIHDPTHRSMARVYLGGTDVTDIEGFRVLRGDELIIGVNPQGGGGGGGKKNILGTILMVVVAVVAAYVGAWVTAAYGPLLGAVAGVAVSMVGGLVINALIKPPSLSTSGSGMNPGANYMVTGQSNEGRPYGTVPRIYGRVKYYPLMAANPSITTTGTKSKFSVLYDFGYGNVDIDLNNIKIGETSSTTYTKTENFQLHQNTKTPQLKYVTARYGFENLTINTLKEVNYQFTTKPQSIGAQLNIYFPQGLYHFNKKSNQVVEHEILVNCWWRPIGTTEWKRLVAKDYQGASLSNNGTFSVRIKSSSAIPITVLANFDFEGVPGTYEIRFIRYTTIATVANYYDVTQLVLLESRIAGNVLNLTRPHTMLEMLVQANNKLNGVVQNLSTYATSILRTTTNGTTFIEIPTRNPAWICVDIMTGVSTPNPLPDTMIDWPSWIYFAGKCDELVTRTINGVSITKPRYTADFVVDYTTTVQELLLSVLSACRASLKITNQGKYGVMLDEEKSIPRQLITPANSWGFSGTRTFSDIPHALRVSYIDGDAIAGSGRADWQKNEIIVYNNGYSESNATLFEEIGTFGITNYSSAWSYGRYMLAQGIHRSEIFTVTMDVENLVCSRGDLVLVAHDVPEIGGVPCRIKAITSNQIQVTELLSVAPTGYSIRLVNGTVRTGLVVQMIDEDTFIVDNTTGMNVDDLIVLGITNRITTPYIVSAVQPDKDLTATLSMYRYVQEIYNVDNLPIPPWNPTFGDDLLGEDGVTSLYVSRLDITQTLKHEGGRTLNYINISWVAEPIAASWFSLSIEHSLATLDYFQDPIREFGYTIIHESIPYFDYGTIDVELIPYSKSGRQGVGKTASQALLINTEVLRIDGSNLTQELVFIDRFPYVNVYVDWTVLPFDADYHEVVTRTIDGVVRTDKVLVESFDFQFDLVQQSTIGGTAFTVEIIPYGQYGVGQSRIINGIVATVSTTPAAVQGFGCNVQNSQTNLFWQLNQEVNIREYVIRYSPDIVNGTIEYSQVVGTTNYLTNTLTVGSRTGLYFIQAVDTSGNIGPSVVTRTSIEQLPDINVVDTVNDQPGWTGGKSQVQVNGTVIELTGPFGNITDEGYYYYATTYDLGYVQEVRITNKTIAHGELEQRDMVLWVPLASQQPLAKVADRSMWDTTTEYRVTDDVLTLSEWEPNIAAIDPISGVSGITWSDWRPFQVADITGRMIQFRIKLQSFSDTVRAVVDDGLIEIDAVDRVWKAFDLSVPSTGLRVTFDQAFIRTPVLAITIENSTTAVRYEATNRDRFGFDILLRNNAGTAVSGQIDVAALGMGKEQTTSL